MVLGCHSTVAGAGPRGRTRTTWVQKGWRTLQRVGIVTREPIMVEITTEWNPLGCGRLIDGSIKSGAEACIGCENEVK